jgi:hypothetical protein
MKKKKHDDKDGLYSSYYDVPAGARDLVDLMNHKGMSHSVGEAFCALYRLNDKDTPVRNLEKAIYYASRELERIKKENK